jgi:hypothetical protein
VALAAVGGVGCSSGPPSPWLATLAMDANSCVNPTTPKLSAKRARGDEGRAPAPAPALDAKADAPKPEVPAPREVPVEGGTHPTVGTQPIYGVG